MTDAESPQCFAVEPGEIFESEPCPCCGDVSQTANGFIFLHDTPIAAYFVRWIKGREDRASWEFVIGAWGVGASAENRYVVCAEYRLDDGPGLMIVDADGSSVFPSLAAHRLNRADVIGDPLAQDVFAIYDTIVLDDGRLATLHPWRTIT